MKELTRVNRLEIIDWTGQGKRYIKWVDKPFKVSYDLQDDGRTLKLFLEEIADETTKKNRI
jgi:hypothetical protein